MHLPMLDHFKDYFPNIYEEIISSHRVVKISFNNIIIRK